MKFEIENNVIASYKRLSYDAWYAFAEFVDNSTQSYFDNKEKLDAIMEINGEKLEISIEYSLYADTITIRDNSIGMDETDLIRAFRVGQPPANPTGRSKYGLGMKTAACWFGDNWKVRTKKLGHNKEYEVSIDVDSIAKQVGDVDLVVTSGDSEDTKHYTVITITNLNRKFAGKTLWKIKDYLSSIYRFDISSGISIKWNNTPLTWLGYEDELHITSEGVRYKKLFSFEINGKPVNGWVGVLGKGYGSRKKAGFSIIQSKRVIQTGYKPISIFGEQEDGGNDLINQRVVGELSLDKFSVSHTKDKIVWEDDEEELLNDKIGEYCSDAKELARTLRFHKDSAATDNINQYKEEAVSILSSELKSSEINNYVLTVEPHPEKIIASSYNKTYQRVVGESEPVIQATLGEDDDIIHITIYFSDKSEFEPYVLTETTVDDNRIVVIINILHPQIQEMKSGDAMTNFIRHCIYDGVAEWKAVKVRGSIQPYTIKFIKDGLLRIPFEIKQNQFS